MPTLLSIVLFACSPAPTAGPPPEPPVPEVPTPPEAPTGKKCPDFRIDNQMPTIDGSGPSHYYIVDGQRVDGLDEAWIAANCNVPVQTVQ